MIAQQPESASLGEYGPVVIDRTIFEAKDQTAVDPVAFSDLGYLTVSQALAVQGAQCKKAVHQAFHVAHAYLFSGQRNCLEWDGIGHEKRQYAKPQCPGFTMPSKPFVASKLIPTWHVLIPAEIQEILKVQICNDAE